MPAKLIPPIRDPCATSGELDQGLQIGGTRHLVISVRERGLMKKSTEPGRRLPQGYCVYCEKKTPHVHERRAINRMQVVRSLCLACNREQPKETANPRSSLEALKPAKVSGQGG